MRRFLTVALLTTALVAIPTGLASADPLSAACTGLNTPLADGLYNGGGGGGLMHNAGDVITISASVPTADGTRTEVRLIINGTLKDTDPFPGTVTYTIPADGIYTWGWSTDGSNSIPATWDVSCAAGPPPPPSDSDGDGVIDDDDVCPNTVLSEPAPTRELKKNRFSANGGGQFVDGNGTLAGISVVDTAGCSGEQIIDAAGLGKGHTKFGITRGALLDWIAGL